MEYKEKSQGRPQIDRYIYLHPAKASDKENFVHHAESNGIMESTVKAKAS